VPPQRPPGIFGCIHFHHKRTFHLKIISHHQYIIWSDLIESGYSWWCRDKSGVVRTSTNRDLFLKRRPILILNPRDKW
jgi:hypothetical protein